MDTKRRCGGCIVERLALLWVISCILIALPFRSQGKDSDGKLNAQDERFRVLATQRSVEGSEPQRLEIRLDIEDRNTGKHTAMALKERMAKLSGVDVTPSGRLLLFGSLARGGKTVIIYDLNKLHRCGAVWNYGFSVSPKKRYIAYIAYYPPMALPSDKNSQVLILDLESMAPESQEMQPGSPKVCGVAVFPRVEKAAIGSQTKDSSEVLLLSPFLWSEDESKLVFLAFMNGGNFAVVVSLDERRQCYQTFTHFIPLENIVDRAHLLPSTVKEMSENPVKLTSRSIQWKGVDTLLVEPYPQYWLPASFVVELPRLGSP